MKILNTLIESFGGVDPTEQNYKWKRFSEDGVTLVDLLVNDKFIEQCKELYEVISESENIVKLQFKEWEFGIRKNWEQDGYYPTYFMKDDKYSFGASPRYLKDEDLIKDRETIQNVYRTLLSELGYH